MPTQRITIDIETDEDPSSVLDAAQEIAHELASRIDGAADDDLVSVYTFPATTRTSPNGPAPDRL